jgi:hypothetical protein
MSKKLTTLIIEVGKSVVATRQQVVACHLLFLGENAESTDVKECKKRTTAQWQQMFIKQMNTRKGFKWPVKEDGNTIGYRAIMLKPTQHDTDVVAAAHYLNSLQSYLHSNDRVQPVKKPTTKSSRGHVTTTDQILKQLNALFESVPEANRENGLYHLKRFAKSAFGIEGYSGESK